MNSLIDNLYYKDVILPFYKKVIEPLNKECSELHDKIYYKKKNIFMLLFGLQSKDEKRLKILKEQLHIANNIYKELLTD